MNIGNIQGWLEEINCNIGVKKGCMLSPTLFGICISMLQGCLEKYGCVGVILASIVIILLLYANDIVHMVWIPYDINKKLQFFMDFYSYMRMNFKNDKIMVMIIKSKNSTYVNFMYDKNNLEEMTSYKYLKIDLHHKLN